jgi:hypothetical protein
MRQFRSPVTFLAAAIALMLVPEVLFAQYRNCLRVMPIEELTRGAILIIRAKVIKVEKAKYEGIYSQIATLEPIDFIEGDYTLKRVSVFAHSNVRCAADNYVEGQEVLVFLEPERSLYHTLNFQFGQFVINNGIVKGWRNKSNVASDKPYPDVRLEIEACLTGNTPKQSEAAPPESTNHANPVKPGQQPIPPESKAEANPKPKSDPLQPRKPPQ